MINFIIQLIKKLFKSTKKPIAVETIEHKIILRPSPNYSSRDGKKINCIVIHHTGTNNAKQDIDWLTTKEYINKDGKTVRNYASAHYVIDRSGMLYRLVKDQYKAWHAGYSYYDGLFNVNEFSIGIELVGNGNTGGFTDKQYDALIWLCNKLIKKHHLSKTRITSHSHIRTEYKIRRPKVDAAPKYDPGNNFSWNRLLNNLNG